MRMPTKFVAELTTQQESQLKAIMKSNAAPRTRMRAHAILLSHRCYSIDQIADIYQVDRDRVSQWLERWREFHFAGLSDEKRAGRPKKLSATEQEQVLALVREEPRSVRRAVSEVATRLKKKSVARQ